jgi:hypothetical protein
MPGRDISIPRPEPRGRGLILASALAALTLLAIGLAIGSRIAPARQPPVATRAASPDVPRASPIQPRVATAARTRPGAVTAATRAVTAFDGDVLLEPARLRTVVSRIASRGSRLQLIAAFAEASAQTRAKLGADTVPRPVIVLRSVPVGYRVERYSSAEATIAVWYVGIVGSGATVQPQQSWRTQVVSLVWEAGAWKVSSFASSPGPTPPLSTVETTYAPGDLFAAIPRFEEFERAEP